MSGSWRRWLLRNKVSREKYFSFGLIVVGRAIDFFTCVEPKSGQDLRHLASLRPVHCTSMRGIEDRRSLWSPWERNRILHMQVSLFETSSELILRSPLAHCRSSDKQPSAHCQLNPCVSFPGPSPSPTGRQQSSYSGISASVSIHQ